MQTFQDVSLYLYRYNINEKIDRHIFKSLASLCSLAGWIEPDLVTNLEEGFSHMAPQIWINQCKNSTYPWTLIL